MALTVQVLSSIKELKALMKDKAVTTEVGEVMGESDQDEPGDEHKGH
jgi:hypothetical protein